MSNDSKNFAVSMTIPESWGRQVRVVIITILVMVLAVAYGHGELLMLLAP